MCYQYYILYQCTYCSLLSQSYTVHSVQCTYKHINNQRIKTRKGTLRFRSVPIFIKNPVFIYPVSDILISWCPDILMSWYSRFFVHSPVILNFSFFRFFGLSPKYSRFLVLVLWFCPCLMILSLSFLRISLVLVLSPYIPRPFTISLYLLS